ncbi:triacylglycerol lipase [Legionella sp. 16cNR16C]|uniref:esterase/lipase family protein n=1 Tax=Legionella sp. 16cNR16C TaxID=2905656 RepID=UPI001E30CBE3|nr:alpha/beta hydrolase [Legionella sp. 16cNR16C]MCE3043394.1 alpha/beta hydrolase [Legionella sp. 16cNR16C]
MASSSKSMLSMVAKIPNYLSALIKKNHPVSWTGILFHTMRWLQANSSQLIIPNPKFKPDADVEPIAIYCIHGTADRELSFLTLANQLIELGLPELIKHIVLVNFEDRATGAGMEDFEAQLLKQIIANNDKRVILMGHSRGGIIASAFAEYLAEKNGIKVEMIIPICAPFGGSYLALKALGYFSRSVAQMQVNSEFLIQLEKVVEKSTNRYYFIEAGQDWIVLAGCAIVPGYQQPNSVKKFEHHGHLSIMTSGTLVKFIQELLLGHYKNDSIKSPVDKEAIADMLDDIIKRTEQEINSELANPGLFDVNDCEIISMQALYELVKSPSELITIAGYELRFYPDYRKIKIEKDEQPVEALGLFDV